MARFGFCGASYTSESPNVAAQLTMNWYPETPEDDATTPVAQYPTPGMIVFANPVNAGVVTGLFSANNRLFTTFNNTAGPLWEIAEYNSSGGFVGGITGASLITNDATSFAQNNAGQLAICLGGGLYILNLNGQPSVTISTVQVSQNPNPNTPSVEITFSGSNPFGLGEIVSFSGVGTATFLNGLSGLVTGAGSGPSNITVLMSTPLATYGPAADTGTAAVHGFVTPTLISTPRPFAKVAFIDGYFIGLVPNSQQFYISQLEDGTIWNPIDLYNVSEIPDNIISMISDHRQLWLFGVSKTLVYYDSGDPLIPFQPIPGGYIEQGCAAKDSPVQMDNSVFWLGSDERGNGVAWRANGYTPVRVSNFAVENAWRKYATISDAVGYSFQMNGHTYWQLYFPTANATWRYDAATGRWHQVSWFNGGVDNAHRSRCHAFCFGKHIVGDTISETLYEMNIEYTNDTLNTGAFPIHRIRRATHISSEQEWTYHQQLQVYLEAGLGNSTVLDPQISLRWSNDGGHTWSNYYAVSAGAQGNYTTRCMWRRLGRARDRIYEISVTDAIPWRIVDAYLQAVPGFSSTPRLVDRIKQQA